MGETRLRRVYLHVGVPKTGTTHLQDVLWRSRAALLTAGVSYPLERREQHFAAAMDLRKAAWAGRRNPAWDGTWARLAAAARSGGVPVAVLSSELLAAATPEQAAEACGSFGDAEVHVVLTVRDLARQLPSAWQEQVKHRQTMTLEEFVSGCLGGEAGPTWTAGMGRRFWQLHDVPAIAGRWASAVGSGRVHLVTVPSSGAPPQLLWERFSGVVGISAGIDPLGGPRSNTSLGPAATELLRRLNEGDVGRLRPPDYDPVARAVLAEKVLTRVRPAGEPELVLPPRFAGEVAERAAVVVQQLQAGGYPVAGDLRELLPGSPREPAPAPDDSRLAELSVRATAGLVTELGQLEQRLRARSRARGQPGRRRVERWSPPRRPQGSGPPGPVFMHIGAPKTGTTFLQDVLWHHRAALAAEGLLFTRERYDEHYRASLDLRHTARQPPAAAGSWGRVAARASRWPGTAVVSHELFAAAAAADAARAVEALGRDRVHIVYSVRDLWSLLGAEWQESTKHGRSLSFDEYLADVLERGPDGVVGRWFWSVHDAVGVLERWGAGLPPERVHVVTLPPPGSEPGMLWRRFAGVLGVDPDRVDTTVARPNASLGAAEVTFLRQVNAELAAARTGGQQARRSGRTRREGGGTQAGDGRLDRVQRSRYVKGLLAQQILAERAGKQRFAPPLERFDEVLALAEATVQQLGAAGYSVAGDLTELLPRRPGQAGPHPDHVAPAELVAVGADALTGLVQHAVRLRTTHLAGPGPATEEGGTAATVRRRWHRLRSRLDRRLRPVARRVRGRVAALRHASR